MVKISYYKYDIDRKEAYISTDIIDNVAKVIFNPPATIVFFRDGSKTVVKAHNEEFDEEKGFLMALTKRMSTNNSTYMERINKIISKAKKVSTNE